MAIKEVINMNKRDEMLKEQAADRELHELLDSGIKIEEISRKLRVAKVTLSVNPSVVEFAREYGINLSKFFSRSLQLLVGELLDLEVGRKIKKVKTDV